MRAFVKIGALVAIFFYTSLQISCDQKECNEEGCECVDNKKYCCEFSDGLGTSEKSRYYLAMECEEYGATCVEHNETNAYCHFLNIDCTDEHDGKSLCVGDIISFCYSDYQHPVSQYNCATESGDEEMTCCNNTTDSEAQCCLND